MKYFSRVLSSISLVIFMGLLFIGLWPLDFSPANEVWWLKDEDGLHFHGRGIGPRFSAGGSVFTPDPLVSPHLDLYEKGTLSIEIWLEPAIETSSGRSRILSFCNSAKNETLFVDQWKSHLIVFTRCVCCSDQKKYREIGIRKALIAGKSRFITITSGKNGTCFYLDGKLARHFPEVCLVQENESLAGQTIMLGNSPYATQSWAGNLYGLAVYDHILTDAQVFQHCREWTKSENSPPLPQENALSLYAFNEKSGMWAYSSSGSSNPLLIPDRLQFEKRILVPPDLSRITRASIIKDAVINVAGFIPFGFFISLWLIKTRQWNQRYIYIVVIILGFLVSLTIELLQIYLPARDSSLSDLFCNTLGASLGVSITYHARQKSSLIYNYLKIQHTI